MTTITRLDPGPDQLRRIVVNASEDCDSWLEAVRFRTDERWYQRVGEFDGHELWLLSWLPGQSTMFHDHGMSCGALRVLTGTLEEHVPAEGGTSIARILRAGDYRSFGRDYVHDVRNVSEAPAVSLHAYAPRLTTMNRYRLTDQGLVLIASELEKSW